MSSVINPAFFHGLGDLQGQGSWWVYLLWVPVIALLGFSVAEVFAGLFHLPRRIFLIPYVAIVSLTVYLFMNWSGLSLKGLVQYNWVWGVIGAVVVGMFLVRNILSQPASTHPSGLVLIFDLLWSGVVYGLMDALLLSVLPVLAIWQALSSLGWTANLLERFAVGAIALVASLLITICYHLGFPEYRVKRGVFGPSIGNGIMTLGYLLTNNPVSAILSHIAMHIAGVMHGPDSVIQLPPHYAESIPKQTMASELENP